VRRKGELSPSRVDRDWPHQIVLKANDCTGQQYNAMHDFCADLSLCPLGHSFVQDDAWMRVFCFAERERARGEVSGIIRGRVVRSKPTAIGARLVKA